MKTQCKILLIFIALSMTVGKVFAGNRQVLIKNFLLDSIEICDTSFSCKDVDRMDLPDATKSPVIVENFDQNHGMVMFQYNGENMWVHQSEVKLNEKAVASVVCTGQSGDNKRSNDISYRSDRENFTSFGLGEGCK
ncbi:MAG: hypothetical protein WBB19_19585 [Desulforhopalus sp.]